MSEPTDGLDRAWLAGQLAQGVQAFNSGQYWEAHEAWEEGWLALREADRPQAASAVQGLILVTAGLENLSRAKPSGFRVQLAKALARLRANQGQLTQLGVVGETELREALLDLYLDAQAHRAARLEDLQAPVPELEVQEPKA